MKPESGARRNGVNRRVFVTGAAIAGTTPLLINPAQAARTPAAVEGPYYPAPHMRFEDTDHDLTIIRGSRQRAQGTILDLRGRVVDKDGSYARAAKVEIWQCDANGRYIHSWDLGVTIRDPAFQGYGQVTTGNDGRFHFRTIRPVAYTGRTPHIHMKVTHRDTSLTTQFYVADDPGNRRDRLYRRMSEAERQLVTLNLAQAQGGLQSSVTIYL